MDALIVSAPWVIAGYGAYRPGGAVAGALSDGGDYRAAPPISGQRASARAPAP